MSKSLSGTAKLISAKELSRMTQVSYAAINNYTDIGLLEVVAKQNRLRMYEADVAKERLAMIIRLTSEGYTLRIIAKLLKS
jgi:DNA-binding transcriptional MerR regulator